VPGELGNEEAQLGVGYYENRYRPYGEWNDKTYGTSRPWEENEDKKRGVLKVVKRMLDKEKKEQGKEKQDQNTRYESIHAEPE